MIMNHSASTGNYSPVKLIFLIAGPASCAVICLLPAPQGLSCEALRLVGLASWMVVWWFSEAVPLAATALLPIPFMPILGIADQKPVAAAYAHPIIFLFLGGFIIAAAMQRWNLHKRIALLIVLRIGTNPTRIVAGFMIATAFLSMWISNTATAIMMFAVGLSLSEFVHKRNQDHANAALFSKSLMLGIAYAASIGGVATLIGTPPNGIFAAFLSDAYGMQITFSSWMCIGFPFVLVMLPLCWLVLTRGAFNLRSITFDGAEDILLTELRSLGPVSKPERIVLIVFSASALLWITRPAVCSITGLSISDTTIALCAAVVLFITPLSLKNGSFVCDWECAARIPWGVLLLFGGGLSLAVAFQSTGLATAIGHGVSSLHGTHSAFFVLVVTGVVILLTELTSNTATTAAFLPIMGAVAVGAHLHPMLLCLPVTLAASMAFMMPVATPPNAIVFACRGLSIRDMVRAGFFMNMAAIILIPVLVYVLAPTIFDITF